MATTNRAAAWTIAACVAVLTASAALAGSAAATKSPTLDEPFQVLSGWLAVRQGDYRLEVATPPLWKMWAALGDFGVAVPLDRRGPIWQPQAWSPVSEMPYARRTLFDTPGVDGQRFVGRARVMSLLVGVALGAAIAAWGYRLGGPVAAVAGLALFALDPTVLGQAGLAKSDVTEAAALFTLGWLAWRFGRRATAAGAVGLGLACGAAVNVKFTGVVAGPILAALLAFRALGPTPWSAFGRVVATRAGRCGIATATVIVAAAVTVGVTWACYRFRYRPTPDPAVAVDVAAVERAATAGGSDPLVDVGHWVDHHRLLPQAFTAGLISQGYFVRQWPAFLDGQLYVGGRWQYFPLAAAYKTPLAELAAAAAAAGVGVAAGLTRPWRRPGWAWAVACVGGPAVFLAATLLASPLNAGLRNAIPVYPYLDLAGGLAAAWAWRRVPRTTAAVLATIAAGQMVAVAVAWPDYIAFFNAAVGGPAGGAAHLADGNLDWGQDVPALVAWQRAHPDVPLYADLFTSVDPAFYGLRYHKLWERTPAGRPELHLPTGPAVLAMSVTHLQGLYDDPDQMPLLRQLGRTEPRAVLHGSIELFDWPLPGP